MKTVIKAHLKTGGDASVAVLARALALPEGTARAGEFVFMPAGENVIEASVNGKPEQVTVIVDEATAKVLQEDLSARQASSIRPALDYNHEGGRASGWPTGFRWSDGFGVVCEVEWTPAAVAAIRAGEWRYFSPEFRYDRKTKRVLGLRATGPVGGLVNDPAFRAMPAIAARHAAPTHNNLPDADDAPEPPKPTQQHHMQTKVLAALAVAGILSDTEAAADNASALVTARLQKLKADAEANVQASSAVTAKDAEIKALRLELDGIKATAADAAVEAAVKAGRIAPKDEATRKFWKDAILRDGESVKALNAVPVNPALKATGNGSQEQQAATPDKEAEFYEAVTARARQIEKTTGVTFGTAFTQAEAEIKASQA